MPQGWSMDRDRDRDRNWDIYIYGYVSCFALLCIDPLGAGYQRDRNSGSEPNGIDLSNHAPTSTPDYGVAQIIFARHPPPRGLYSVTFHNFLIAYCLGLSPHFPPPPYSQPVASNSIRTHTREVSTCDFQLLSF